MQKRQRWSMTSNENATVDIITYHHLFMAVKMENK